MAMRRDRSGVGTRTRGGRQFDRIAEDVRVAGRDPASSSPRQTDVDLDHRSAAVDRPGLVRDRDRRGPPGSEPGGRGLHAAQRALGHEHVGVHEEALAGVEARERQPGALDHDRAGRGDIRLREQPSEQIEHLRHARLGDESGVDERAHGRILGGGAMVAGSGRPGGGVGQQVGQRHEKAEARPRLGQAAGAVRGPGALPALEQHVTRRAARERREQREGVGTDRARSARGTLGRW